MSPIVYLAKQVHLKASRNSICLLYIAIVVTVTLVLAIREFVQALGR